MQVSIFWPSLSFQVDGAGASFSDATTGFSMRVSSSADPLANPGVTPFGCKTFALPTKLLPVPTAIGYESKYVRKTGAVPLLLGSKDQIPKGSSSDWHDDSRSSHSTGGARRRFVSIGFARAMRGVQDGAESMRSFATDQENRPVGHVLKQPYQAGAYFDLSGDGWKFDQKDASGWAVVDPAHLEEAAIYGGAILGDQVCAAHLILLGMNVASSLHGAGPRGLSKGWRGSDQERAIGEMVKHYVRLALFGVGMGPACASFRDLYLSGADPKQHLVGLLKDLIARPPPFGAGNVDARTMPDIGTVNGRRELMGAYGWQRGIMHWWLEYALRSGLINEPLRSQTYAWLLPQLDDFAERAVANGLVSYSLSRSDDLLADHAMLANENNTDKEHHTYEYRALVRGGGIVRDIPRRADSEVSAPGLYLGNHQQDACDIIALKPTPDGDPNGYAKVATYLEPILALQEAGGP